MKKEKVCPSCHGRGKVPDPENLCVVHEVIASSPLEVVNYINRCYHDNSNWNLRVISILQYKDDRWAVFLENLNATK